MGQFVPCAIKVFAGVVSVCGKSTWCDPQPIKKKKVWHFRKNMPVSLLYFFFSVNIRRADAKRAKRDWLKATESTKTILLYCWIILLVFSSYMAILLFKLCLLTNTLRYGLGTDHMAAWSGMSVCWSWLFNVQSEHQNAKENGLKWLWSGKRVFCYQTGWSECFSNCWSRVGKV